MCYRGRAKLLKWAWGLAVAVLLSPLAIAQNTTKAAHPTRLAGTITMGTVDAVAPDSITLKAPGPRRPETQTVFPLGKDVVVNLLKPANLADVKEPQWVTVIRGGPAPKDFEGMVVWRLKIAPKMPAGAESGNPGDDNSLPPLAMRYSVSGMLDMRGATPSLKVGNQTLNLRFTDRTQVYREVPADLKDMMVGANVMLDLRVVERQFVAKGIDILPEDEGAKPKQGVRGSD